MGTEKWMRKAPWLSTFFHMLSGPVSSSTHLLSLIQDQALRPGNSPVASGLGALGGSVNWSRFTNVGHLLFSLKVRQAPAEGV